MGAASRFMTFFSDPSNSLFQNPDKNIEAPPSSNRWLLPTNGAVVKDEEKEVTVAWPGGGGAGSGTASFSGLASTGGGTYFIR
jgi:hypothetical protein